MADTENDETRSPEVARGMPLPRTTAQLTVALLEADDADALRQALDRHEFDVDATVDPAHLRCTDHQTAEALHLAGVPLVCMAIYLHAIGCFEVLVARGARLAFPLFRHAFYGSSVLEEIIEHDGRWVLCRDFLKETKYGGRKPRRAHWAPPFLRAALAAGAKVDAGHRDAMSLFRACSSSEEIVLLMDAFDPPALFCRALLAYVLLERGRWADEPLSLSPTDRQMRFIRMADYILDYPRWTPDISDHVLLNVERAAIADQMVDTVAMIRFLSWPPDSVVGKLSRISSKDELRVAVDGLIGRAIGRRAARLVRATVAELVREVAPLFCRAQSIGPR